MKNYQMIVFFTVVLTIYSLANTYIYLKGYHSIAAFRTFKPLYLLIFILLASTFIAGKILEVNHSSVVSDILNIIGGFWMAFMLYGFLLLFLSEIISVILRLAGVINTGNIVSFKKWAYLFTITASFILITGGFINALIPKVRNYEISIDKPADGLRELKVAAVSDIHLGSIIRRRSMIKLSGILDTISPDLVLLLGDIVDGEIGPVIRGDLLKHFTCPRCRYGLYAITGNHEYIGGAAKTIPYIEGKGIRILKDEVVEIGNGIQLIGRLDRDSKMFNGTERKPLSALMQFTDLSKPAILLDHQPVNLAESEKNGIDLQLSGHTHNGQMWPLNYVTRRIFELSYGYMKKGNTQFIVSSGFGLWGPRVRSASRSEILVINIRFREKP